MTKTVAMIRNSKKGDFGGGEKYPIITGEILSDNNFKVVIMSSNRTTLEAAEEEKLKTILSPWWAFQNFSGIRVFFSPLYLCWQIYLTTWYMWFFQKNNIDIVYPQSRDDFISASIAGKILHKKVIWTDHADLKHIYMNNKVWYKNPVGKLVYFISKHVDTVTLESNSEKNLIEKSLGELVPKNYLVMHIGVVDVYKNPSRKRSDIVFVSTSRLVDDKGIGELIEAFSEIDKPSVKLLICGSGKDEYKFKQMAKDIKNIEFLGFVKDIPAILSKADVLIHPTYHEGFGLSLVEAEMYGLPIIASNIGSIPEIVKDGVNGILVPVKDVQALEKAIRTIVNNSELRIKMGAESRKIFLRDFQFDKIVREKLIPLL